MSDRKDPDSVSELLEEELVDTPADPVPAADQADRDTMAETEMVDEQFPPLAEQDKADLLSGKVSLEDLLTGPNYKDYVWLSMTIEAKNIEPLNLLRMVRTGTLPEGTPSAITVPALLELFGGIDEAYKCGMLHMRKKASRTSKPALVKEGQPRDLNIVPVFTGESGQKAATWIKDYMLVCETCKLDPAKFLPLKLSAVKPSGVSVATREFVESWIKNHGTLTAVNVNDFANDLVRAYDKTEFNPAHTARDKLYAGEAKQTSTESLHKYIARFKQITKDANDMSTVDKIWWFLHGMHPNLRSMCAVDQNGQAWENLQDLIEYALGQEQRMLASNISVVKPIKPVVASVSVKRKQLSFQPKSHWSAPKRGRSGSRGSDAAGPSRLPPPPTTNGFVDPASPDWRTKAFLQACKRHNLCNRCGKRGHARKECVVRIEGDDVQRYRTMEIPPGAK